MNLQLTCSKHPKPVSHTIVQASRAINPNMYKTDLTIVTFPHAFGFEFMMVEKAHGKLQHEIYPYRNSPIITDNTSK